MALLPSRELRYPSWSLLIESRAEYLQLERTYNKDHLVQLPDHFSADQKVQHIIKGIVKMPLKH